MADYVIGDKIVWGDVDGRNTTLREGVVTKVAANGDYVWVDREHKPEDCIYTSFCWPAEYKEELLLVMKERASLRKAFDDSMKLVYQLRNRVRNERDGSKV
jgi:hypothetical protein